MSATLVLRTVKGAPLTNLEVDNNFSNLNAFGDVVSANVGVLTNLSTTAKDNTVVAINEVYTRSANASVMDTGTVNVSLLPTSGVVAATYGNATNIPVIVVDTYGRITSASNVTVVGGVSSVGGATGAVSNAQILSAFSTAVAPGTSGNVLTSNGTNWVSSAAAGGGATITGETASSSTYYPVFTTTTSGTLSAANVSTSKLYFTPSSGTLNATVFNSLSDASQKTDVETVTNAVQTVNLLTGVEFVWADTGKKSAGVIAQELETILPHLVETNYEGFKSVNYSGIIAYLIEANKELAARVVALENK